MSRFLVTNFFTYCLNIERNQRLKFLWLFVVFWDDIAFYFPFLSVESLQNLQSESELSILADKLQDCVHEKTKPAQITDFAGT